MTDIKSALIDFDIEPEEQGDTRLHLRGPGYKKAGEAALGAILGVMKADAPEDADKPPCLGCMVTALHNTAVEIIAKMMETEDPIVVGKIFHSLGGAIQALGTKAGEIGVERAIAEIETNPDTVFSLLTRLLAAA